jgi:hypothetical protein
MEKTVSPLLVRLSEPKPSRFRDYGIFSGSSYQAPILAFTVVMNAKFSCSSAGI